MHRRLIITRGAHLLALALLDRAEDGVTVRISDRTLADAMGFSLTHLRRSQRELAALGSVRVGAIPRGRNSGSLDTRGYTIDVDNWLWPVLRVTGGIG